MANRACAACEQPLSCGPSAALAQLEALSGPCGKCSPEHPAGLRVPPACGVSGDWGECGASGGWSAGGEAEAFPLGAWGRGAGLCGPRAGRAGQWCSVFLEQRGVAGALLTRAPGRGAPWPRPRLGPACTPESVAPCCSPALPGRAALARSALRRHGGPALGSLGGLGAAVGVSGLCEHRCSGSALCLREQRRVVQSGSWPSVTGPAEYPLLIRISSSGQLESTLVTSFEIYPEIRVLCICV